MNTQKLFSSPIGLYLLSLIAGDFKTAWFTLTNMAKHGFGGHSLGSAGSTGGKAKQLIIVIILILIIPFIALLFSGSTTGSSGLYGNATIGYAVRQSTFNFSQFIVLVMVLGALGIVLALL